MCASGCRSQQRKTGLAIVVGMAALEKPEMGNLPEVEQPGQQHDAVVRDVPAGAAPSDQRRQRPAYGPGGQRIGSAPFQGGVDAQVPEDSARSQQCRRDSSGRCQQQYPRQHDRSADQSRLGRLHAAPGYRAQPGAEHQPVRFELQGLV